MWPLGDIGGLEPAELSWGGVNINICGLPESLRDTSVELIVVESVTPPSSRTGGGGGAGAAKFFATYFLGPGMGGAGDS